MKKAVLSLMILAATPAYAAENGTYNCRVKEQKGRQTETYEFRLALPASETQFTLRIFPKVLVDAYVQHYDDAEDYLSVGAYDSEIAEDGSRMDMQLSQASGYNFLTMYAKIGNRKDYSVDILCAKDE